MNEMLINLIPVIKEGLSMMLVGMGTVLIFLCILICAMVIMSACIKKLNEIFPEPVAVSSGTKKVQKSSDDSEIAVAIATALFKRQ